jgi:plastocyanin
MMKKILLGLAIGVATAALVPACSSEATTPVDDTQVVNVTVGGTAGNQFSPKEITVKVGQTVRWTWQGGTHNVVSGADCVTADGVIKSGAPQAGGTFDWKADKAGVVNYHCEPHCGTGMVGTITVQ